MVSLRREASRGEREQVSLGDKASPPKENTLRTNCGRRGLAAATGSQLLTQENGLVDSETFCQLVSEHSRSLDMKTKVGGPKSSSFKDRLHFTTVFY